MLYELSTLGRFQASRPASPHDTCVQPSPFGPTNGRAIHAHQPSHWDFEKVGGAAQLACHPKKRGFETGCAVSDLASRPPDNNPEMSFIFIDTACHHLVARGPHGIHEGCMQDLSTTQQMSDHAVFPVNEMRQPCFIRIERITLAPT